MSLSFEVDERFESAADQWSEQRVMEPDAALEEKIEQALLEVEHLVSGATEVDFTIEDGSVEHEPSEELRSFLEAQSDETGLSEDRLLKLHVDLFANVFLEEERPGP